MKTTKKTIFIILILSLNLNLFSQIEKKDIEIGVDFNAYIMNFPINNTQSQTNIFSISLNSGLSANYYLKDYLSVGIGVRYGWNANNVQNHMYNDSIVIESNNFRKTTSIIPSLKLGLNIKLAKKLFFKTVLTGNYGISSISEKTSFVSAKLQIIDGYYNLVNDPQEIIEEEFSDNSQYNYISVSLEPKFQYYFNNKVGLTLGLGGLEYITNHNRFLFALSPKFWSFGIDFKFNK